MRPLDSSSILRSLRPFTLFLLLVGGLLSLPRHAVADDEEAKPPPPPAGVSAFAGGIEIVLPGRLVSRQSLDDGSLALLVALDRAARDAFADRPMVAMGGGEDGHDETSKAQLLRLDPVAMTLEPLLALPTRSAALAQAPAPGGGRRLLVATEDRLLLFDDLSHDPTTILDAPGLDLAGALRRGFLDPSTGRLLVPRVARLEAWLPDDDGVYTLQGHARLPVRVERRRHGLELASPRLRVVTGEKGHRQALLGPVAEGDHRLWLRPVEPTAEGGSGHEPVEPREGHPTSAEDLEDDGNYWIRFPGPEEVEQSFLLSIDDRVVLAVATTRADKLGVFEKLSLRTFNLRTDLTREGAGPSLAVQTATRNWYSIKLAVVDLDADGRDDLAVLQPAGLGAGKLVLEVYRGKGTGGFFQTPRTNELDVPPGRCLYGHDLDGDRQPDLLVTKEGQLLLYPGEAADHKKRVVEKKPRILLGPTAFADTPTTRTATGDERPELERPRGRPALLELGGEQHVLLRTTHRDRTVLRIVELGG